MCALPISGVPGRPAARRGGVASDLSSGHGRHLAVAALRIARCGPRLAGQDGTDAAPVGRRPAVSVIAETRPAATRIAIYDLDRTVLRKPTFTLFLLWAAWRAAPRSEEHTSELQSLMRISYAVFCLKQKNDINNTDTHIHQ